MRSLTNYLNAQNNLVLGKINFIYCQLECIWIVRNNNTNTKATHFQPAHSQAPFQPSTPDPRGEMETCGQTVTASLCCSLHHFLLLHFLVSLQATGESLFQCLQHVLPSFFDPGVCSTVSHTFFLIPLFASVSFRPFLNMFFLRYCHFGCWVQLCPAAGLLFCLLT